LLSEKLDIALPATSAGSHATHHRIQIRGWLITVGLYIFIMFELVGFVPIGVQYITKMPALVGLIRPIWLDALWSSFRRRCAVVIIVVEGHIVSV